jgi:hypothetical protein
LQKIHTEPHLIALRIRPQRPRTMPFDVRLLSCNHAQIQNTRNLDYWEGRSDNMEDTFERLDSLIIEHLALKISPAKLAPQMRYGYAYMTIRTRFVHAYTRVYPQVGTHLPHCLAEYSVLKPATEPLCVQHLSILSNRIQFVTAPTRKRGGNRSKCQSAQFSSIHRNRTA